MARGFYWERRALDKTPAGGVIGPDELTDVMQSAAYSVLDWVGISQDYAALVNDGDHAGIQARYDDANPQTPGGDNSNAVYLATACTDAPWPNNWNKIRRDTWRVHARAPFTTWASTWGKAPCSFWPAKSARPVKVSGRQVKSKILMVNETLDAAMPYSGALEVRRRFPTASLIEGVAGTTHAPLSGMACTDNAIGQYLTDGTVPARRKGNRSDLQCPPTPQPDPSQTATARTSTNAHVWKELGREPAPARVR